MADAMSDYMLKFKDGTWVRLDLASGGYPTRAGGELMAMRWHTQHDAARYAKMFKSEIQQVVYRTRTVVELIESWPVGE